MAGGDAAGGDGSSADGADIDSPPPPVEDDVDEIPDSDFSKASARVFDKIDNGKYGFLIFSNFADLIETLGEGFRSDDLPFYLWKENPNESSTLD